jgi:hypothetical protein
VAIDDGENVAEQDLVDKIKQMIPPRPEGFREFGALHRASNVRFVPLEIPIDARCW